MINEYKVKSKCKDDISKIENYNLAIADNTQVWHCHHKLELTLDGEFAHSKKDLKRLGMYYKRPYFELIFLSPSEHSALHNGTKEYKQKMSETKKGKPKSEFGRKFKEHYGKTFEDDKKLYQREIVWYKRHNNKCRWED